MAWNRLSRCDDDLRRQTDERNLQGFNGVEPPESMRPGKIEEIALNGDRSVFQWRGTA